MVMFLTLKFQVGRPLFSGFAKVLNGHGTSDLSITQTKLGDVPWVYILVLFGLIVHKYFKRFQKCQSWSKIYFMVVAWEVLLVPF
jgi:uncharacterized protein (DUF983 family)